MKHVQIGWNFERHSSRHSSIRTCFSTLMVEHVHGFQFLGANQGCHTPARTFPIYVPISKCCILDWPRMAFPKLNNFETQNLVNLKKTGGGAWLRAVWQILTQLLQAILMNIWEYMNVHRCGARRQAQIFQSMDKTTMRPSKDPDKIVLDVVWMLL